MPMLPNRSFDMDALKLSTEQNQGSIAVPFEAQSNIDPADTPYQLTRGIGSKLRKKEKSQVREK